PAPVVPSSQVPQSSYMTSGGVIPSSQVPPAPIYSATVPVSPPAPVSSVASYSSVPPAPYTSVPPSPYSSVPPNNSSEYPDTTCEEGAYTGNQAAYSTGAAYY
ncbi:hypothetical protein H4R26_005659, partial [Coemansia thaxteri]